MSYLSKQFLLHCDLRDRNVQLDNGSNIILFTTDENIGELWIKLYYDRKQLFHEDGIGDYKITMTIVKSTLEVKEIQGEYDKYNEIFKFPLSKDLTTYIGTYNCDLLIEYGNQKLNMKPFIYKIEPDITGKFNHDLRLNGEYSYLKDLIKQVKDMINSIQSEIKINDTKISTTSAFSSFKVDELFKENSVKKTMIEDGKLYLLREDGTKIDTGTKLPISSGSGGIIDLSEYQTKKDPTLTTSSKEVVGAINEINEQLNPFLITNFTITPNVGELGDSISVKLSWAYNKEITAQTMNTASMVVSFRNKTYNNVTSNTSYTLKGTSITGSTASKTLSVNFYNGIYWGASSSSTYNDDFILKLTKTISNSKARTITVNAGTGEYIYYCLPARLGTPTFKVGGFEGGFELVKTLSFTNSYKYIEKYNIYKSDNPNLGNTTINIS